MSSSKLLLLDGKSKRPYPTPDRSKVLAYNTHFMGGLLVQSPKYGLMPWWDPCLSWCDSATRKSAYNIKSLAHDTHAMVELPNGLPLYDESGQFYSPDKFGPLDWTNGESSISADFGRLLDEVLSNGFYFHIAMDERSDHSLRLGLLVAKELKTLGLSKYGIVMPGYDSVFYGWDPSLIEAWGNNCRDANPDIILGLEHNVGHIPLGEGGFDYYEGGRMRDFDIIFGEFDDAHGDQQWQILGRMIRPYHRPPDQPEGDDPNPPFYLIDSARGPRTYCYFESDDPYNWVRLNMSDKNAISNQINFINQKRAYAASMGCSYLG